MTITLRLPVSGPPGTLLAVSDTEILLPGHFYTDREARQKKFLCKGVQGGKMTIIAFGNHPDGKPVAMEYVQDVKHASLYASITDPEDIEPLRTRAVKMGLAV